MWDLRDLSETRRRLLFRNCIDLSDEVDESMIEYVRTSLTYLKSEGSPDIEVLITSGGGRAFAGLDIYDILRTYEGNVVGKVYGYARSAAALILQGCRKRLCAKHATVLVHNPLIQAQHLSYETIVSEKAMRQIKERLQRRAEQTYQILAERSGQKITAVRKLCRENRDLSSSEALAFGLIDEIF